MISDYLFARLNLRDPKTRLISAEICVRLASENATGKFLNKSLTSLDWLDDFSASIKHNSIVNLADIAILNGVWTGAQREIMISVIK